MNVLVCEGNDALALSYQAVLEGKGHAVSRVSAGQPALDLALKARFDLALVDQSLPGSLDGIELVKLLRCHSATRLLPVLVTGPVNDQVLRHVAKAAGATGFYAKPMSPQQLLDAVDARAGAVG